MKGLRALRAVMRLEARELLRHRGRSALVLLLVAVPVAAVVGGATLVHITTPTDDERRESAMGRAALRIEAPFEHAERRRLLELLPPTAAVQTLREGVERVAVPGRQLRAKAIVIGRTEDGGADLAEGVVLIEAGTLPRNSGEVALSPTLLAALDRELGDSVVLEYGAARTITGVVVERESLDGALVVRTAAAVEHRGTAWLLAGDAAAADELAPAAVVIREAGFDVTERAEITGEGTELAWAVFVLGTIGFLEAGLVVASTFIVGLRRRQYEIGLLGSTGATAGTITSSLLVSTGALAFVGAVAGAIVGTGFAAAVFPFLDRWNRRLNGDFDVSWGTLVASIVLGVIVAMVSTALPSRFAARLPIRIAMGGRRPVKSRSTTWLVVGLGMVAFGVLLVVFAPRDPAILGALAAIGGSIMGVLGFGVASPFVLDVLGRSASRLPLRWRLALRDAGRFRARNGPVVTAVLAGMSMSVTVAVLVASLNAAFDALPSQYRTDQLLVAGPDAEAVAERIVDELSGIAAAPLEAVYVRGEPVRAKSGEVLLGGPGHHWIAVGDDDLLRAAGAERARDALLAGELVELRASEGGLLDILGVRTDPSAVTDFTLETWRDERALDPLPVTRVIVDESVMQPPYLLHRSKLEQLGWHSGPPLDRSLTPWLVRLDRPVDAALLEGAQAIAVDAAGVTVDAQLLRQNPARSFYYAIQWLCILTGLVIVLVATALSAAESTADARVLHSVGAAPGLVRGHQAARAGYLAFLGCLLAIPAGLVPAVVLFEASNLPLDVVVPWLDLVTTLVTLPMLAYAVTWLLQRDRAELRLRRGFAAALLFVLVAGRVGAAEGTPAVRWEPWTGEAFDGSPLEGELGRIVVPAKHGDPDAGTIELAFVRYRTDHPDPGPPVIFLAGGPGGSGVEHAARTATHPQMRFLEQSDFIGLDQRGTGLSRPTLETPAELRRELPRDRPVTRDDVVRALRETASATVRYWSERGVEASWYNTRESADDIETLRRALGVERIVTYGSSYGSHLALAHLRRHAATVARTLVTRVEGPNDTVKLPSTVQAQLAALHARCRDDARVREELPDLIGTVEKLLAGLAAAPVTLDGDEPVVIGPYDLQRYVSNALSFSHTAGEIPANLLAFSRGDWSALAESARETRTIELGLMSWAMDCASNGTAARLAEVRREAADPANVLGDAILAPHYPESCAACTDCDLGDAFRAPISADVPVLFVSGSLDVRTPAANVERIAPGFPRHAHVLVVNAGHEARELMSPEYRSTFQAFLRGDPVTDTTVVLPTVMLAKPPESE